MGGASWYPFQKQPQGGQPSSLALLTCLSRLFGFEWQESSGVQQGEPEKVPLCGVELITFQFKADTNGVLSGPMLKRATRFGAL